MDGQLQLHSGSVIDEPGFRLVFEQSREYELGDELMLIWNVKGSIIPCDTSNVDF